MIEALSGVAVAVATIVASRALRSERWSYSLLLLILPLLYAGFAALAGHTASVGLELLHGLPFLMLGLLGLVWRVRGAIWLTAAGWLAHAGYDLMHRQLFLNPGVPSWYPVFCASVDVVVGLFLVWRACRGDARPRPESRWDGGIRPPDPDARDAPRR